jgi:hypothetical protein
MLSTLSLFINSPQRSEINKIIIKYVDFNIETLVAVRCDSFEDRFKHEMRTIIINNKKKLDLFDHYLNDLSKDENEHLSPDVRLKMEIMKKNGTADTLCMDNVRISLNHVSMNNSKKFRNLIREVLASNKTK